MQDCNDITYLLSRLIEGFGLIPFFGPVPKTALVTFYKSYLLVENRIFVLDHIINVLLNKQIPVFFNKICKILNPYEFSSTVVLNDAVPVRGPRKFKLCVCQFCCEFINNKTEFSTLNHGRRSPAFVHGRRSPDSLYFKFRYNFFKRKIDLSARSSALLAAEHNSKLQPEDLLFTANNYEIPPNHFNNIFEQGIARQFSSTIWPDGTSSLSSYFFSLNALDSIHLTIKPKESSEIIYPHKSYLPYSFHNPLSTCFVNYNQIYSTYKQDHYNRFISHDCAGKLGPNYRQTSKFYQLLQEWYALPPRTWRNMWRFQKYSKFIDRKFSIFQNNSSPTKRDLLSPRHVRK